MGFEVFISNRFYRRRGWLLIGLLVIMVAGCAGTSSRPPSPTRADSAEDKAWVHSKMKNAASAISADDLATVERQLRSEVRQWEGTPHRMGGASRRGMDCSGFVQRLYQDIFDQWIPRSTVLQVQSGQPIDRRQLRTGDLVFFKVPGKGRHVGIYLGQSEFAHASTSRGVIISSLEDRFWRQAYWTARRYLMITN